MVTLTLRLVSCTKCVWYCGHRDHVSCIPKTEELFQEHFYRLSAPGVEEEDIIPHAGYYKFKKDSDANDMTVQQYYHETYNIHIK